MAQRYQKNIWLLYAVIFFHNLIPAYVIERLFWQERGMNVQMVVWCEIIYAVTVVVLELPSGLLADRFGRKKLIVFGNLLACSEFAFLIYAHDFWHFGGVVFLAGISKACTSGAWNALLYDSMLADGVEEQFVKVLGRMQTVDFSAAMLAALSGGFLAATYGLVMNYQISILSMIIALLASLYLREPPLSLEQVESPQTVLQIARKAGIFFRRHLDVSVLLIHAMLVAACVTYVDEFWQIYLDETGFPLALFGLTAAGFTLARIPGALIAAKLLRFFQHASLLLIATLCGALGILAAALFQSNLGIIGFLVLFLCAGLVEPICSGYIHQRADSQARATIDSISSLVERIFSISIGLVFGYVASSFSIFSAYILLSGVLFLAWVVFAAVYPRQTSIAAHTVDTATAAAELPPESSSKDNTEH